MRTSGLFRPAFAVAVATLALASAGCGGNGDSSVVRPPSSTPSVTATPTLTPSSTPTASTPPTHPRTVVRPSAGLRDGQVVTVTASGFSPGLNLIVIECADKGHDTGPGDCNMAVSTSVQTDAAGRASTRLKVSRGPFGSNGVVCGATVHCLVSVTEASLTPSQEADAPISFG